jgi:hypothetical protein
LQPHAIFLHATVGRVPFGIHLCPVFNPAIILVPVLVVVVDFVSAIFFVDDADDENADDCGNTLHSGLKLRF